MSTIRSIVSQSGVQRCRLYFRVLSTYVRTEIEGQKPVFNLIGSNGGMPGIDSASAEQLATETDTLNVYAACTLYTIRPSGKVVAEDYSPTTVLTETRIREADRELAFARRHAREFMRVLRAVSSGAILGDKATETEEDDDKPEPLNPAMATASATSPSAKPQQPTNAKK